MRSLTHARPFVAGPNTGFRECSRGGCYAVSSRGGVLRRFLPLAVATPFPNGANALFIGHSFFVPISRSFDEIALSSGAFPQHRHQEVFSGGKSGTPRELWDSQQKRAAVTAILADGDIDLPGLTPGAARLSWDTQDVNRLVTEGRSPKRGLQLAVTGQSGPAHSIVSPLSPF